MQKIILIAAFAVSLFLQPSAASSSRSSHKRKEKVLVSRQSRSPWPTEPDTIATCSRWIEALPGDDCNILAEIDAIPLSDFLNWNPALYRDCYGIKVGFGYCTENKGVLPSSTSRTTSRTATTTSLGGAASCPPISCPVTYTVTTTVFVTIGASTTSSRATTSITTTPVTTSSRTTTTSSRTTTTGAASTLHTSMFPPTSTVQCVASNSPIPSPNWLRSTNPTNDITPACNDLVTTGSKYLEVGDPYKVVKTAGDLGQSEYILAIKLGGFSVTNALCVQQFALLFNSCSWYSLGAYATYGGCIYTSDYNLMACIFPKGYP